MPDEPIAKALLTSIEKFENRNLNPDREYDERMLSRFREQREEYKNCCKAIELLANMINRHGSEGEQMVRMAIAHATVNTHRYLQQGMIQAILQALGDLGALYMEQSARWADARNELAMKWCRKLREQFRDELF